MQTRYRLLAVVVTLVSILAFAPGASALTYDILIENLVPGGMATGNPLTPPLVVVHDGTYQLFMVGGMASAGLELQAEEGDPSQLAMEAELAGASVVVGGGPFFDMMMVEVEGEPGELISISTMFARSNDLITGIHDVVLPDTGSMMMMTNVYDAGTEVNTGLMADIPFYGNAFVGPDETQPIAMIGAYSVLDDPGGQIDYVFPPAARITITANPSVPTEESTWGELKHRFAR